ncbi:hypothetical protein HK102_007373 [Quaeritorhiza haematococci]|nr:hypothetical protein HK102_007373 [Quaeritorhiza haematococci]
MSCCFGGEGGRGGGRIAEAFAVRLTSIFGEAKEDEDEDEDEEEGDGSRCFQRRVDAEELRIDKLRAVVLSDNKSVTLTAAEVVG